MYKRQDKIIDPSQSACDEIEKLLSRVGVYDIHEFSNGKILSVGGVITKESPLIDKKLLDIHEFGGRENWLVTAFVRNGESFIANGDTVLKEEDHFLHIDGNFGYGQTIAKYSLEEAEEVFEAIKKGDSSDICEELGDLLFQVIFHSQIKSEEGKFSINDVIKSINRKMIRRNPHVFDNQSNKKYTLREIEENWMKIKKEEKINQ